MKYLLQASTFITALQILIGNAFAIGEELSCNFFIDLLVAILAIIFLLFIFEGFWGGLMVLGIIGSGLMNFWTYTYDNLGVTYVAIGVLPLLGSLFYFAFEFPLEEESTPKSDNEESATVDPKTAEWRRRKFAQNFIRSYPPSNTTVSDLPHNFEKNNHEKD